MTFDLNPADTLAPIGGGDLRDSFVPPEDCAERMGISVERVAELVRRGVLRANRGGYVQPAVLSGAVPEGN